MRRDEVRNSGAGIASSTGLIGIADLVEKIRPVLHHDATLRQV